MKKLEIPKITNKGGKIKNMDLIEKEEGFLELGGGTNGKENGGIGSKEGRQHQLQGDGGVERVGKGVPKGGWKTTGDSWQKNS